jgi:lipopolysaccharide transport system permease protein
MSRLLEQRTDSWMRWTRFLPEAFDALYIGPLRQPNIWIGLAWLDVVQSYRRTVIGPVWITLNLVIFTFAMTLIYGALFGLPTKEYAGFLACGMIGWFWCSALLTEVGQTFINYSYFIKGTPMDKSLLVWATAFKQVIVLGHQMIVYAGLVVLGIIPLTVYSLAFIPALFVMFLMSIPITAIAAILFARYRDLSRLVSSAIIVLMMVTPIFWQAHMLSGWRLHFVRLNPLYYLIEFMRTPLLGKPLEPFIIAIVLVLLVFFWVVGANVYSRYQKYVVFWL